MYHVRRLSNDMLMKSLHLECNASLRIIALRNTMYKSVTSIIFYIICNIVEWRMIL